MGDDDTWMNPKSVEWIYDEKRERDRARNMPWLIERCRRVPVTGNVAFIEQWDVWSRHATRDERDVELRKLRNDHSWTLRPARVDFMGHHVPHIDEDAILAHAQAIKALRAQRG